MRGDGTAKKSTRASDNNWLELLIVSKYVYVKNSPRSVKYLDLKIHGDVTHLYHYWRRMLAKYFFVAWISRSVYPKPSASIFLPDLVSYFTKLPGRKVWTALTVLWGLQIVHVFKIFFFFLRKIVWNSFLRLGKVQRWSSIYRYKFTEF